MITRRLTAPLRRLMSPRAYRRLIRAGAVLGAIASIYAFLTLEVFSGLLSPASGRLSPVFKVMEAMCGCLPLCKENFDLLNM